MKTEDIKLHLDGRWELTDLNVLTRVYIQIYSLLYSLKTSEDFVEEEFQYIYGKYPWRGGYSAVNFYNDLFYKIPRELRPKIKSIQYSSPGFIELSQFVGVANDIAQIVIYISSAISAVNETYSSIQKGIKERELSKINLRNEELKLLRKQQKFIRKSIEDISRVIGIRKETLSQLYNRTENNELAVLKILLSLYRRARDLAKLQLNNKLYLDENVNERKSFYK
ncbi:hypothetical protein K9N50_10420 [bacterium]|nr:hypothetical protein [bacterium]